MYNFDLKVFSHEQVIVAYNILQVELCTDEKIVKKTYYKLARVYHPDKNKAPNSDEKFKEIGAAYEYLQQYKEDIKHYKSAILKTAAQHKKSQASSIQKSKKTPKKEQANETNMSSAQQDAYRMRQEIPILLSIFKSFPSLNQFDEVLIAYRYLLNQCTTQLLNEGLQLKEYLFNMENRLNNIKNQLLFALNYGRGLSDILPKDLLKTQRDIFLRRCFRQIAHDINVLNIFKMDLDKLWKKLREKGIYSHIISMNSFSERINTLMVNLQLREYYFFNFFYKNGRIVTNNLPHEFTFTDITRLTDESIQENSDLSSYFTALAFEKLYNISNLLTKWHSVTKIKIKNSPLIGFPSFLCQMPNLKVIELLENKITTLPNAIGNMSHLEVLILDNNYLNALPSTFAKLRLKRLSLSNNQFESIPNEILKISHLEELSFENTAFEQSVTNNIRNLPLEMKNLINLVTLSLNGNLISYLPENVVEHWKKLQRLSIANNSLETLPKNIGDISSLNYLDARSNFITFIPSSILKLKGTLKTCLLHKNQLNAHSTSVAAILHIMGNPQPQDLFNSQTFEDNDPMILDNYFSFEQDKELLNLTQEYLVYLTRKHFFLPAENGGLYSSQFEFNHNVSKTNFRSKIKYI